MNFADSILLRLASTTTRDALLSQPVLETMARTAFDLSAAALSGPYALAVERLDLGVELQRPASARGTYEAAPGSLPGTLQLQFRSLAAGEPLRIDSLWRGQLIARAVPTDDRIAGVGGGFVALDLDRAIAAHGPLPSGVALEAARRQELLHRLRSAAVQQSALGDETVDWLLQAAGADSVGALLAARGAADPGVLRISFSPPAPETAAVPVRLPVTIAVLLRESLGGLARLLAEGRSIAAALADDPSVQPPAAPIGRRLPILQLWFVPQAIFDDPDWPGSTPAQRASALADLLSAQGIALAPA